LTKRLAQAGKFIVPLILGFFIARTIIRNWQQVREADWQFAPLYIVVALVLSAPWFVYRPFVWKLLLARFGSDLPFGGAFRIMRQAELSRYVPGTVWQYLSRVYLASRWGVPATACLGATLIETVLLLLAALPPALWNLQEMLPVVERYQWIMLAVFLIASVAVVHPRILNWWAAILARYTKQPYQELRVGWMTLAGIWISYVGVWLSLGVGLAFFVRGVMLIPFEQFPTLAGDYAASWVASMLAVVAPAGMGVRDGVFGQLLSRMMPLPTALTVALAVRLWLTLLELVWVAVARTQPGSPPETSRSQDEARPR
jgi:hypothetical protein